MENMTKTLALEYAPHGIRANAIALLLISHFKNDVA